MAEDINTNLRQLHAQLAEVTRLCKATLSAVLNRQESSRDNRPGHAPLRQVLTYYQAHEHNLNGAISMQQGDRRWSVGYTADGLIVIRLSAAEWSSSISVFSTLGSDVGIIETYQADIDTSYWRDRFGMQFILPDGKTLMPTDFEPLTLPDGAEPLSFA